MLRRCLEPHARMPESYPNTTLMSSSGGSDGWTFRQCEESDRPPLVSPNDHAVFVCY